MARTTSTTTKRKSTRPPAVVSVETSAPSHDEIAARAYELFLLRGGVHGHDLEDWARAERELSKSSH
jgi:hypothetical protein